MSKTLKQLREESGLTLRRAAQLLREVEPTAPETHVGLKHIENRGTERLTIIRAMERVYNVPFEVVEQAACHIGTD